MTWRLIDAQGINGAQGELWEGLLSGSGNVWREGGCQPGPLKVPRPAAAGVLQFALRGRAVWMWCAVPPGQPHTWLPLPGLARAQAPEAGVIAAPRESAGPYGSRWLSPGGGEVGGEPLCGGVGVNEARLAWTRHPAAACGCPSDNVGGSKALQGCTYTPSRRVWRAARRPCPRRLGSPGEGARRAGAAQRKNESSGSWRHAAVTKAQLLFQSAANISGELMLAGAPTSPADIDQRGETRGAAGRDCQFHTRHADGQTPPTAPHHSHPGRDCGPSRSFTDLHALRCRSAKRGVAAAAASSRFISGSRRCAARVPLLLRGLLQSDDPPPRQWRSRQRSGGHGEPPAQLLRGLAERRQRWRASDPCSPRPSCPAPRSRDSRQADSDPTWRHSALLASCERIAMFVMTDDDGDDDG
ncbi:unnamed protein product [Lampetra fluviatilis]